MFTDAIQKPEINFPKLELTLQTFLSDFVYFYESTYIWLNVGIVVFSL